MEVSQSSVSFDKALGKCQWAFQTAPLDPRPICEVDPNNQGHYVLDFKDAPKAFSVLMSEGVLSLDELGSFIGSDNITITPWNACLDDQNAWWDILNNELSPQQASAMKKLFDAMTNKETLYEKIRGKVQYLHECKRHGWDTHADYISIIRICQLYGDEQSRDEVIALRDHYIDHVISQQSFSDMISNNQKDLLSPLFTLLTDEENAQISADGQWPEGSVGQKIQNAIDDSKKRLQGLREVQQGAQAEQADLLKSQLDELSI